MFCYVFFVCVWLDTKELTGKYSLRLYPKSLTYNYTTVTIYHLYQCANVECVNLYNALKNCTMESKK